MRKAPSLSKPGGKRVLNPAARPFVPDVPGDFERQNTEHRLGVPLSRLRLMCNIHATASPFLPSPRVAKVFPGRDEAARGRVRGRSENMSKKRAILFAVTALLGLASSPATRAADADKGERHVLYVAVPGIRNYLEFGGAGILVFDRDKDHAFIKRIETPASRAEKPENIKGICACAATRKLYFTTLKKLYCLDLVSEKTLWERALPGGCDRMATTPDGKHLYVPSLEGPHWHVIDGANGHLVAKIEPKSGS